MGDLLTVMQKELREYFAPGGSRRSGLLGILLIVVVFGVFIPLESGRGCVTSPFTVAFYGIYLPLSLVTNVIADAIAGERERHTLETLLASRLSDRTILLGKLFAAVTYTWVLAMGTALVGMVVANLKPVKLMGVESRGMLLAAGPGGSDVVIAEFSGQLKPGESVH